MKQPLTLLDRQLAASVPRLRGRHIWWILSKQRHRFSSRTINICLKINTSGFAIDFRKLNELFLFPVFSSISWINCWFFLLVRFNFEFSYSNLLLKRVAEIQHDQLSDTAANPDDGHFRQTLTNPFSNEELQQALDSIGPNLSPDELWLPVVRYHVLRLMLTPVVEGLLLLDRLFRLQELGMLLLLLPLMTNNEWGKICHWIFMKSDVGGIDRNVTTVKAIGNVFTHFTVLLLAIIWYS